MIALRTVKGKQQKYWKKVPKSNQTVTSPRKSPASPKREVKKERKLNARSPRRALVDHALKKGHKCEKIAYMSQAELAKLV